MPMSIVHYPRARGSTWSIANLAACFRSSTHLWRIKTIGALHGTAFLLPTRRNRYGSVLLYTLGALPDTHVLCCPVAKLIELGGPSPAPGGPSNRGPLLAPPSLEGLRQLLQVLEGAEEKVGLLVHHCVSCA